MSPRSSDLPVVAITMGDAAGIGPEVTLKALSDQHLQEICTPIIIGDEAHLRQVADLFGLGSILADSNVAVKDLANLPAETAFGADNAVTGKASAEYIEKSVELWRAGEIEAVATAPISKNAVSMAGYPYPGHTEFFAALTETEQFAMSFFAGDLRVVLLSTHLSLKDAIDLVTKERLIELVRFSNEQFSRLLRRKVKLAVAGLNPHASEGGMFGHEEADEIIPAVEYCAVELGIDVTGPYSPDTVFLRCSQGEFDAVVALYHDQATIPVKSLAFNSGVNVTLGLPLIRTSVDHGTAFDIAGKGVADPASMTAAIKLAAELAAGSLPLPLV